MGSTYTSSPPYDETSGLVYHSPLTAVQVEDFSQAGAMTGPTSTMYLRLSRSVPKTEVTSSDFRTGPDVNIASVTGRGTGTSAHEYDIILNNSETRQGRTWIQFEANSISGATAYSAGPPRAVFRWFDTYDNRVFPLSITSSSFTLPTGTQRAATSTITLTVPRAIPRTGQLTTTDFSISDSSVTIASVTGQGMESTATVFDIVVNNPSSSNGTYTITLAANAINAGSGYAASPSSSVTSSSITYDTRTLVSVSSFTAPDPTQIATTTNLVLTLDTGIPRTGELDVNDFSPQMGSGASIASVTGRGSATTATIFDVVINNPNNRNGTYTINFNANSISTTTLTGPSSAYTSESVTYDRRPELEINEFNAPTGTQRGSTSTFTLEFDRVIPTGQITTGDFSVQVGSAATINSVSPVLDDPADTTTDTFSIVVTNPTTASGTYTITINTNAVDAATGYKRGPTGTVSERTSTAVTYNTKADITVSSFVVRGAATQTGARTTLRLTLNRVVPVGQITTADFTPQTGSRASVSSVSAVLTNPGDTTSAVFDVIINNPSPRNGTYTIDLNMNAVSASTVYNAGPASAYTSDTVTYDTRSALPIISTSFILPSGTQRTSTSTTILFLPAQIPRIGQLEASDFSVSNSAVTIASVTGQGTGTNTNVFNIVTNNPSNATGSYTIRLNAESIDAVDNNYLASPAAAVTSGSITYDTVGFGATWQAPPTFNLATGKISANIQFSHRVTGITVDDFEVVLSRTEADQSWTFDTVSSSVNANTNLTISATAPANSNETFKIKLKENSVNFPGGTSNGPSCDTFSGDVAVDNRAQLTISSFNAPTGTQRASTSTFQLILSHAIPNTGQLELNDFRPSIMGATLGSVTAVPANPGDTTFTPFLIL